jgi:hypothetical protein
VRDAAYGTLLRGRRQALHARVVATLEQFPDMVATEPERLRSIAPRPGSPRRRSATGSLPVSARWRARRRLKPSRSCARGWRCFPASATIGGAWNRSSSCRALSAAS